MTRQKHFYLIRGLIREARHWGDFPSHLLEKFPGANLTTLDIPGAGEFYNSPSPLSIKKMVEEMRRVYLEKTNPNDENILVAISLGGMISAQWMKLYPEDFKEAILINTSYGGLSPVYQRLKPDALKFLLKVPTLKGRAKEARILRLVTNHNQIFDRTLNLWEQIQKDRPVSLSNTIKQLLAAAFFRIGKWKPEIPVLLIGSKLDRMVSIECSRAIQKAWSVPLVEHMTGGHDLTADDPAWVSKEIHRFISSK